MAKSLDSEEHERRMSEQADAEIDTLREVNAALVEALEALNSPTTPADKESFMRDEGKPTPEWVEVLKRAGDNLGDSQIAVLHYFGEKSDQWRTLYRLRIELAQETERLKRIVQD